MRMQPQVKSILHSLEKEYPVIKAGRNHKLQLVSSFTNQTLEDVPRELLVFSKSSADEFAIIAYNNSTSEAKQALLALGNKFDHVNKLKSLYGYECCSMVEVIHKKHVRRHHNFVQLYMQPGQLVILKAC